MTDKDIILVVDDNEMNRDMLSRRLQRQGFEVALAENGLVAMEMMQAERFALVLLDVMMPRMNGYEVLQAVKADPKLKSIPVIMISAVDDLDSVVRCIEMGADDYLFKPFNPILLKARVEASLKRSRSVLAGDALHDLREIANELIVLVDELDETVDAAQKIQYCVQRLKHLLK